MSNTADPATVAQAVYNVKSFVDPDELKRDLAFSDNNLSDAMMRQASLFAHYGMQLSDAARQVDVVKLLLENTEAAVYKIISDEKANAGEKVTVPMMDSLVARHSRVIAMKKALNEAKREESRAKMAVEAFRHRRDMLVQKGLISREEMKGELSIQARTIRQEAQSVAEQNMLDMIRRNREEKSQES